MRLDSAGWLSSSPLDGPPTWALLGPGPAGHGDALYFRKTARKRGMSRPSSQGPTVGSLDSAAWASDPARWTAEALHLIRCWSGRKRPLVAWQSSTLVAEITER